MPTAALSAAVASPPDISAILTSLGVFSLAIAAVVGGIYKGIKEVKKGGEDKGTLASSIIMDRAPLVKVADSNDRLVAVNTEIITVLRSIDRGIERLAETMQDSRETVRSQIEEQHRLRAATVDLVEMMRRRP